MYGCVSTTISTNERYGWSKSLKPAESTLHSQFLELHCGCSGAQPICSLRDAPLFCMIHECASVTRSMLQHNAPSSRCEHEIKPFWQQYCQTSRSQGATETEYTSYIDLCCRFSSSDLKYTIARTNSDCFALLCASNCYRIDRIRCRLRKQATGRQCINCI